jgi:hypothetical protein
LDDNCEGIIELKDILNIIKYYYNFINEFYNNNNLFINSNFNCNKY